MNKPEILAPAGSYESMEAAVKAGADAVYMGGQKFGARAYAENPDEELLQRAIDYVHFHGRKIYLTVNTLLKEEELTQELYPYLLPYYEQGLDAVIVQDYGVLTFIKEKFPLLPVHASTQMTVTGVPGARLIKELGVSRLVLPRELSLEEIRAIHQSVDLELEAFIHGALCYGYSGQCLLSSLIGGRSGNRGRCAQPCRLPYNGKKLMNLKDLYTLRILPEILEAGIVSLKIEGRMKSPRYTAGVVSVYRKYVDYYLEHGRNGYEADPADEGLLQELFDRGGFTEGYYEQHNGSRMIYTGDKPVRRLVDEERLHELDQTFLTGQLKEKIKGKVRIHKGIPATIDLWYQEIYVHVEGAAAEPAAKQPLTEASVRKQLGKTGGTEYEWEELLVEMDADVFLPVGVMNTLRRNALEALTKEWLNGYKRII